MTAGYSIPPVSMYQIELQRGQCSSFVGEVFLGLAIETFLRTERINILLGFPFRYAKVGTFDTSPTKEDEMTPLRRHDMRLRAATTEEIEAVWEDRWYGLVVCLSTVYTPLDVQGLALVDHHDEMVGLVTYHVDGPAGQIVTLDTMIRGRGFGRYLLEVIENKFHDRGLGRAWALMTSNFMGYNCIYDNQFYTQSPREIL